jgi:hypothetical protein
VKRERRIDRGEHRQHHARIVPDDGRRVDRQRQDGNEQCRKESCERTRQPFSNQPGKPDNGAGDEHVSDAGRENVAAYRDVIRRQLDTVRQTMHVTKERRGGEEPEHGAGIVLDGEVLDRSRIEEMFHARRQTILVDVHGRVPEIGAEADEPDDEREHDNPSQREREGVASEDRTDRRG